MQTIANLDNHRKTIDFMLQSNHLISFEFQLILNFSRFALFHEKSPLLCVSTLFSILQKNNIVFFASCWMSLVVTLNSLKVTSLQISDKIFAFNYYINAQFCNYANFMWHHFLHDLTSYFVGVEFELRILKTSKI